MIVVIIIVFITNTKPGGSRTGARSANGVGTSPAAGSGERTSAGACVVL